MTETRSPFADGETVWTFGGLSVENGFGEVFIHGNVSFVRDAASAERAKSLAALLLLVAREIESGAAPAPEPPVGTETVNNPFAL